MTPIVKIYSYKFADYKFEVSSTSNIWLDLKLFQVAFLLSNPVSDLVNPDCLNFHFSWNENLKRD